MERVRRKTRGHIVLPCYTGCSAWLRGCEQQEGNHEAVGFTVFLQPSYPLGDGMGGKLPYGHVCLHASVNSVIHSQMCRVR